MGEIATEIEARLRARFQPAVLRLTDDSARHAGHGHHHPDGETHFSIEIESAAFVGMNRVERQRAVNLALADLLAARVHALALRCRAPGDGHG